MRMRARFASVVLSLGLVIGMSTGAWAIEPINATYFGSKAIEGYDPVAYHTTGVPTQGKKSIQFVWKGANWYFSSTQNRALFQGDPARYAPRYGGYCAYAIARNKTASIDPHMWTIVDDVLYLNYSRGVREKWLRDRDRYIVAADGNWPGLLNP